jgi:hypothetical protein
MRRILHARLLATALAAGTLPFLASAIPAQAQTDGDVSFDSFHDQLAQYGYWVYSDRWGLVWQPADVSDDFRPYYSRGRWVYTDDYGWLWSSDYPWGDIAFHYGRWVNDPDNGWMWIPGYTWSPGWVVWRSNGRYIGWMPAPPDRAFLGGEGDVRVGLSFGFGGGAVSFGFNQDPYYGYRGWYGRDFNQRSFADNWTFVGTGQLANRDYGSVEVRDPGMVINIIHQTRNVTNYTVVNNYVVNKSIDVHVVERAAGHPIQIMAARSVIRQPNLIMHADAGQRIQMQQRAIAPHGSGLPNSAPPPSAMVVDKLSAKAPPPRNGQAAGHVFTKTTVAAPDAQSHFHGAPPRGAAPAEAGPGGMRGPGNAPGGSPRGPAGGMTGPGGETPATPETRHREPGQPAGAPGGMTGPGGETPATPETRHREPGQPAGAPGGMTGPGGETPATPETRHREPGQPAGAPGGMTGPGGETPATPETRHREPGQPAGAPGGMTGPGGETPATPATPETRHRPAAPPAGGPGTMTGPTGETAPAPETRHREPTPPAGGPGSMSGPTGETPPAPETRHRPAAETGGAPGMTGPTGAPPPHRPPPQAAPAAPPPAAPGTPPPEKKKHKPDEPPPPQQ